MNSINDDLKNCRIKYYIKVDSENIMRNYEKEKVLDIFKELYNTMYSRNVNSITSNDYKYIFLMSDILNYLYLTKKDEFNIVKNSDVKFEYEYEEERGLFIEYTFRCHAENVVDKIEMMKNEIKKYFNEIIKNKLEYLYGKSVGKNINFEVEVF